MIILEKSFHQLDFVAHNIPPVLPKPEGLMVTHGFTP